eukprot:7804698-Pyramimonas_sp.AAC.1
MVPLAQVACVSATQDSASRPHDGGSTEGSSCTGRMRRRHPGQRFVARYGAPQEAPVAKAAC